MDPNFTFMIDIQSAKSGFVALHSIFGLINSWSPAPGENTVLINQSNKVIKR